MEAAVHVKRVIGNNAVLAVRGDDEVVVLGKGIGFGRRAGDLLDADRVEQVFFAEDASPERLALMLSEIPPACLRVAGQIAEAASLRLQVRPSQSLILPLGDHLAFAVRRAREETPMAFPLLWEVSQLYPQEFEIGQLGVRLASQELRVRLDDDEAVAIAMHLVNAQFAGPGHSDAVVMTETIARIMTVVEQTFGITVARRSMSAARFVTHLRYVFARVAADKQITESHTTLFDAMSTAHPEAMACAAKIHFLIETSMGATVTPDETAYLGLHVARLLADDVSRQQRA
jgi:beta-glucoside operon transcriptional antiterminator